MAYHVHVWYQNKKAPHVQKESAKHSKYLVYLFQSYTLPGDESLKLLNQFNASSWYWTHLQCSSITSARARLILTDRARLAASSVSIDSIQEGNKLENIEVREIKDKKNIIYQNRWIKWEIKDILFVVLYIFSSLNQVIWKYSK